MKRVIIASQANPKSNLAKEILQRNGIKYSKFQPTQYGGVVWKTWRLNESDVTYRDYEGQHYGLTSLSKDSLVNHWNSEAERLPWLRSSRGSSGEVRIGCYDQGTTYQTFFADIDTLLEDPDVEKVEYDHYIERTQHTVCVDITRTGIMKTTQFYKVYVR